jgi:HSF-type DNA-binding
MSSNATGFTQAELNALLGAPASQANFNMLLAAGGSPGLSGMAGEPTPATESGDNAGLGMASSNHINNNNLLFLLQRQAEEQQKMAQLAALTSLSSSLPTDNLALLIQQQQQLLQLQALSALPSASAAATNRLFGLGGAGFGLAGLGGLGDFSNLGGLQSAGNLDLLAMSKLLPAVSNPMLGAGSVPAYSDVTSIPNLLQDRKRKGRTGTFPQKLHTMLSDLERQDGGSSIASFLPHGRAFAIHKPRDFVKHVMPKYFRMSRFSSFQRQLNLYDFQRITEGPDKGAYFHELFVQNRPILSTMMKRNKIKGKGSKNQPQIPVRQEQGAAAGSMKVASGGDEDDQSHSDSDDGEEKGDEV